MGLCASLGLGPAVPPVPPVCHHTLTIHITPFFLPHMSLSCPFQVAQQKRMLDDIISTRDDQALALALHEEIEEDMLRGMKRSREERERDDNCSYHWETNSVGELRLERSSAAGAGSGGRAGSAGSGGRAGSNGGNVVGECLICQEDMRQRQQRTLLTCGHSFHKKCIMRWLPSHPTCPICRENVQVA